MSTETNNTAVAEEIPNLLITPNAQEYLHDLLEKQNTPGIGVRIFVENPGTPRAECCMAYSAPEEIIPTDYKQDYQIFLHLSMPRLFHIYVMRLLTTIKTVSAGS